MKAEAAFLASGKKEEIPSDKELLLKLKRQKAAAKKKAEDAKKKREEESGFDLYGDGGDSSSGPIKKHKAKKKEPITLTSASKYASNAERKMATGATYADKRAKQKRRDMIELQNAPISGRF